MHKSPACRGCGRGRTKQKGKVPSCTALKRTRGLTWRAHVTSPWYLGSIFPSWELDKMPSKRGLGAGVGGWLVVAVRVLGCNSRAYCVYVRLLVWTTVGVCVC